MITAEEQQALLKKGTVLQEKYRIDDYLASGGFGNTYLVTHIALNRQYAMKEFFVRGINHREQNNTTIGVSNSENVNIFTTQKNKFLVEAQRLSQLDNPHIVRVHDLFEENGTAYYVMDFINGSTLSDKMKKQKSPFDEDLVKNITMQMLDALDTIHAKQIYHMDLKPDNIIMDETGKCVLIDFGSSKQTTEANGVKTATAVTYTQGFAPPEQITGVAEKWGPATDYYALGATIYNLLTNRKPPVANEIIDDPNAAFVFPVPVGENMQNLVKQLMAPSSNMRPKSTEEIRKVLAAPSMQKCKAVPLAKENVEPTPYTPASEETVVQGMSMQPNIGTVQPGNPVQPMGPNPVQPMGPTPMQPMGPTPMQPMGPNPMQPMGPNPMQPMGPTPMQPMSPNPPKRGAGLKVLIIILAALLVAGLGVGLFFILKSNNTSNDPVQQSNIEEQDTINGTDGLMEEDFDDIDDKDDTDDSDEFDEFDNNDDFDVTDDEDDWDNENGNEQDDDLSIDIEEDDNMLEQYVNEMNNQCPLEVEEGMVLSDTWLSNKAWVIEFTLDEQMFNEFMAEANANKAQTKNEVMKVLTQDEDLKMLVNLCKKNGKDISFWFKSDGNSKIVKITANLNK